MTIRGNTPLSDSEMRLLAAIFNENKPLEESLAALFPYASWRLDGDVLYIGAPPWDISQELHIVKEL